MVADQNQIEAGVYITAQDQNGDPFEIDGLVIPIVIATDEIAGLLADYDPAVSASPSAADSRVIARVVMDALRKQQGL
tara:strand:- start:59 stop:292 length:234 start_codon:yes stop_codon:yes gene_type:complete